jgi:SNF2 family DNA or RNA helicase
VVLDNSPETIKRWQEGRIGMLLLHGASGGHGLNLYTGGNHIIWMGATYDLELYDQVNARLSHPEKTDAVTIHRLLASGVRAESEVVLDLIRKGVDQKTLLRYVANTDEGDNDD